MSGSALYETFSRAPLTFERGEGCWLDRRRRASAISISPAASPSIRLAMPIRISSPRSPSRRASSGMSPTSTRSPARAGSPSGSSPSTFADKVFFTNSGAEALECAIKTARRYQYVSGHPERFRTITFEGAFHGRTLATIAAGGQAKYLEGFGPKVDGFDQVPFDDIDAAEKAITPETAAILIEPIQGEGGIREVPAQSLRRLRELCDKHGLLLIFDEVQCGIGRTGKLFAYEWVGVSARPDGDRQGHRRRLPGRRLPGHRRGGRRHDRRRPRHHLRRQSAGHGGRQCRARRRAGRRLPRRGHRARRCS